MLEGDVGTGKDDDYETVLNFAGRDSEKWKASPLGGRLHNF